MYPLRPGVVRYANSTIRWLLAKDRREEAIAIMAKYHGDGDENHPLVQLQLREITEDFSVTRNDNPWWDFRELYNTKAARYRIMMVIAMAFFGQWSGKHHALRHSADCQSYFCQAPTNGLLQVTTLYPTSCPPWSRTPVSTTPTSSC